MEPHTEASSARRRPFDALAWLVLAVALVLVFATFRQYGVAWDEQGETVYGALLLKYYSSGFRDHSAFEFVNFRFYGGGFELPAALLARISPFGQYETRHLLSALLGIGGLAASWRVARILGGARAGALALLLLVLNPSWYGHLFINARDVPFGAGMMCCLLLSLHALDELPRISWRTTLLFGLALGWTVSVRIGGVMALLFWSVAVGLWLIARARSGAALRELAHDALRIAGSSLASLAAAYLVMIVFWPWAIQSPWNPLEALTMFSRFPYEGQVLFDGRLVPAMALPASYLPVELVVTQPILLLCGLVCAAILAPFALYRQRVVLLERASLRMTTVAVAALFPVFYFVLARPVAYNGMRHFLFVIPTLSVLAALAFDRMLTAAPTREVRNGLSLALVIGGMLQARNLIALHPDEYVSYNELVGGPRGAQGRYELDYWGTSLAEATRRFTSALEQRGELPRRGRSALKVHVCGNVWSAALFFPPGLTPVDSVQDADFLVAIASFYCEHLRDSRRVLDVAREGALLSYVDDVRAQHAHAQH